MHEQSRKNRYTPFFDIKLRKFSLTETFFLTIVLLPVLIMLAFICHTYTVVASYDSELQETIFNNIMVPHIVELIVITAILLTMMCYFYNRLAKTIRELSLNMQRIAKDENPKITRSSFLETTQLAKSIILLKRHIKRQQKRKVSLEQGRQKERELLKIIRDSYDEKELFLRELYHAMNNPLNIVIAGAEILKSREFGNDIAAYDQYFDMILQAGKQIASYTTDIINPSEVDVKELIWRCIKLQKKKVNETRLKLEVEMPNSIPPIIADELRLRQIIISTISHSISCIQDHGTVKVKVVVRERRHNKPYKLAIVIEDNGLGINEAERMEHWERAFGNNGLSDNNVVFSCSRNPDITRLNFEVIRHLVALHKGSFELLSMPNQGSVFTIVLPYLTRKQFEANSSKAEDQVSNNIVIEKPAKDKKSNIIIFPKNRKK